MKHVVGYTDSGVEYWILNPKNPLNSVDKIFEKLRQYNVVGQSEQLICEYCNEDAKPTCCDSCLEGMVNAVQKAN